MVFLVLGYVALVKGHQGHRPSGAPALFVILYRVLQLGDLVLLDILVGIARPVIVELHHPVAVCGKELTELPAEILDIVRRKRVQELQYPQHIVSLPVVILGYTHGAHVAEVHTQLQQPVPVQIPEHCAVLLIEQTEPLGRRLVYPVIVEMPLIECGVEACARIQFRTHGQYRGLHIRELAGYRIGEPFRSKYVGIDIGGGTDIESICRRHLAELHPPFPPEVGNTELVAAFGQVRHILCPQPPVLGGDIFLQSLVVDHACTHHQKHRIDIHGRGILLHPVIFPDMGRISDIGGE